MDVDKILAELGQEMQRSVDALRKQEAEKATLQNQVSALQAELAAVQDNFRQVRQLTATEPEDSREIVSLLDAITTARELSRLVFLPSALDAAKKAKHYRYPAEVYDAFLALQDLAEARLAGPIRAGIEEWLRTREVTYAQWVGQGVENPRTREQYWFVDGDGERRLFEEHLKFGNDRDQANGLRVYMRWDAETGRWIIAYVGKHLENAQS